MDSIFRAIKHTGLLSTVAWAGKQRFQCQYFCGKAGRGFLALAAVPSRVRILRNIQEPCNIKRWGPVAEYMRAVLFSILGIVCLRDECIVNFPCPYDHTSLLADVSVLNETALRSVNVATPGEGVFVYRYFLSKKDEEPRLESYDGGKIPTTKVPLRISRPWTKDTISKNDEITLSDDQVLLHFRQIGANTTKKEYNWVIKRPKDEDIVGHARFLGSLIQSEILETAVVLIGFAILAICFGPLELQVTSFICLAAILLLEGILSLEVDKHFHLSERGSLAQDGFAMLHLILCSQAGSILSRQKLDSESSFPLPDYVEVTMIGRRSQNDFKVLARTRVEVRHIDDPEYGPHFRTATMPYTTGPILYLTLAHGFFWCLSTTLLPNYNYHKKVLATIAAVNGLLKFMVPVTSLPWLAGIFVLADSYMDYVGFRRNPNINPRIRPFRDLPQVLPAIGVFGAIYDALRI